MTITGVCLLIGIVSIYVIIFIGLEVDLSKIKKEERERQKRLIEIDQRFAYCLTTKPFRRHM